MTLHATYKRRLRLFAKTKNDESNTSAPSTSSSHSGLDRISSLASQWAQVLMLALVAFGYFYTVRPVYQKEVLEEESAKLKIENSRTKREVSIAQQRATAIRSEMNRLEKDKEHLLTSSSAIQNQNRLLSSQRLLLQKAAQEASEKLSSLEKLTDTQIEEAQTTLLLNTFSLHFWSEIDASDRPFLEAKPDELEKWFAGTQKQPVDIIAKKVDEELRNKSYFGLPKPHAISQKIVERISRP